MTGFGKAAKKSKKGAVTVEIRALNHKFFELSAKIPNGLTQYEDRFKNMIHQRIKRGKVYLNIELNGPKESSSNVTIDNRMARRYTKELAKVKKALRLKGEIRLDQLIALPGVLITEGARPDYKRYLPDIKNTLGEALDELIRDRAKEGRALCADLSKRIKNIKEAANHIDARSLVSIVRYKNHLTDMIKELTGTKNVDKGRLEQEVALFAKNCDISEELTRIKSHLSSFAESLMSGAEVGKKLDFIAQELHREANTIASKSSDFKISRCVIQMKSDIEKIREQVKNVE
jgi:uncharacterized protein (TIGR00255 family)